MVYYDNFLFLCGYAGVTPTALLRSLGLSTGLLGKWKNGSIPNSETARRVADALGVTMEQLLDGKNTPATSEDDGLDAEMKRILPNLSEDQKGLLFAMMQEMLRKK